MLPAWVSKLKDLKAMKSKQKQSKTSFLPPSSSSVSKSPDTDFPMYFAQALSVQRANSNTNCARLEGSLGYLGSSTDTDSIFSPSDNDAHTCMQPRTHISTDADAGTSKLCNCGSTELFNSAEVPVHANDCKYFECDFHAMSSCGIKVGPHLYKGKMRMVPCVQSDLYGAIDNDTEGSNLLTPNTIVSSFGSESSSAHSSMVHKSGYAEDNSKCLMLDESSGLESHESRMEGSVYPEEAPQFSEWQGKTSSEDPQGACSLDMEAMSRLNYCEGALDSSKFQRSSLENFKSACSLDMEAMSRLTYNEGQLNWQGRSSLNVAENHSFSSLYECHTSAFHASRIAPGCAFSMWYEGSPSFANHSSGAMPMPKEERKSCAPNNVSSVSSNLQQKSNITAKNCSKEGCKVSIVEDLKVIPSLWKERSIFEGTMLCSLSYSEWEERSALIAVENPGLMLSSKWHENPCTSLESSAKADQNSELPTCVGQDNRNGRSMCVWQDNSDGLSMCVQQDNSNGLSVCFRQDNGNAGYHKSIHDAYLRRGRRHRGSSFSAALPKDLQGVVGDSIALVKMSHNPYEDFWHSMYEMIMEKDLEESMDVEELLYCYLSLNSPEHHELIEEVFSDVWSSILMSVR